MRLDCNLEAAHRIYLTPPEDRMGILSCSICGENRRKITYCELHGKGLQRITICDDCLDDHTFPYDAYPEFEDMHYMCSLCGKPCENSVTLIDGQAYCRECIQERMIES